MRRAWLLGTAAAALGHHSGAPVEAPARGPAITACEGKRAPLPASLSYELRAGAFPGSGRPDVAVHVPPGFDATRRPGVVIYFHGWNGCVEAALSDEDTPCSEGGEPRPAAHLATQMDEARVNALLVAVELRADAATGEPGQLALVDDARELLRELFAEHLAEPLGCTLDLDDLDRIVLVSHSGGYQATASTLAYGGLPRVTEVVLLDSLYGADDVFSSWLLDPAPGPDGPRRFVSLYTCCGVPFERSHAMARAARAAASERDERGEIAVDDEGDADGRLPAALTHPVVFALVGAPHDAMPQTYVRAAVQAGGFAPLVPLTPVEQ
jgi:hypothetical protein